MPLYAGQVAGYNYASIEHNGLMERLRQRLIPVPLRLAGPDLYVTRAFDRPNGAPAPFDSCRNIQNQQLAMARPFPYQVP
jgi:hypothetical protein